MPRPPRRAVTALAAATAALATGLVAAPGATADQRAPAPLHKAAHALPGRYIVTLAPTMPSDRAAEQWRLPVRQTFREVLNGFSADLTPQQLRTVRRQPGVVAVEQVGIITGPRGTTSRRAGEPTESWGLDRIDQRELPLDATFNPGEDGEGTTAYIVDSGIDFDHATFEGRASLGYDAFGGDGKDCYGHGTKVASIAGGATYGVARKAKLVSVRVLNCENRGTSEGLLAGYEWIAKNAVPAAVVNSSLSSPLFPTTDAAVDKLAKDHGILTVAAAGNQGSNACLRSPARAASVLAVGNSTRSDVQSATSNYGRCVSLYAPGHQVLAAQQGGGSATVSGTSFAAPYATGAVLLALDDDAEGTPAVLKQRIIDAATPNVLTVSPGSPNRLLYLAPSLTPDDPEEDNG
ncbi:S8 family peptidase [Streptomyces spectabilis]|uniref:S8 family peptidase n=1 Tax=Streptomyces spectabilis TaxID=68270 RepID=A0A516R1V2_STRST|nr:S8 family peptidase [Streptomyces spectabilis]QDQ09639.1 S8 family peptidase [Streptomyces spectabilis]